MSLHRFALTTAAALGQLALVVLLAFGGATSSAVAEDRPALVVPAWTVPDGWKKQDGERAMRHATFNAGADDTAIEVSLSTFPGDAGGLQANINRWRGQVGLKPILEKEELHKELQSFENPGYAIFTMHLKGEANHMLGAIIIDESGERTWFIKATAGEKAITANAAGFVAFAKSFKAPN